MTESTRRGFLTIAGTSIAVGLAGCTSSGDSASNSEEQTSESTTSDATTSTPEPEAEAIDSIEIGTNELTVSLMEDTKIDTLRLLNPDGSERTSDSVGAGVTTATLAYFDTYEESAYTAGEYTVVAVKGEEVLQEMAVEIQPKLKLTAIEGSKRGYAQLTLKNTGSGAAWIRGGKVEGGQQEASEYDTITPVDGGDGVIAPGDAKKFNDQVAPFKYSPKGDKFESYCTGEGPFSHDLTIVVEEEALGTVTGDVSVALTGEKQEPAWNTYTCSNVEADSLPATLAPSKE